MPVRKAHALRRQLVEMGSLDVFRTLETQIVITQIVRHNYQYIGSIRRLH